MPSDCKDPGELVTEEVSASREVRGPPSPRSAPPRAARLGPARPGGSVIIITGPNENSQKASISVNVLAANSQDEVYE